MDEKILVGFNCNVDRLIKVNNKVLKFLGTNNEKHRVIKSLNDVGRGLRESIKYCKPLEWSTTNEKIVKKLMELEGVERIGGQAGIANNVLLKIGFNVDLITSSYHPFLEKFLHKKTQVIHSNNCLRVNHVFEFKKNNCSNRFIASYHPNTAKPIFKKLKLKEKYDKGFFSGLQLLNNEKDFETGLKVLKKIKKNVKLMHYENVHVEDKNCYDFIKEKVYSTVDSLGFDEHEFKKITKTENIEKGLTQLSQRFPNLSRIHVHSINGHYCLINNEYPYTPKQVLLAHKLSVVVAYYYSRDWNRPHKFVEIGEGEEIKKLKNHSLIKVPNLKFHGLKNTVGLGDVLSSVSFASESLF